MKEKVKMGPGGPDCSRLVAGFWRLNNWNYSKDELREFIQECLDLGVTTMDHADIYGDYTCESIFGEAIAGESSLREKMQIVTKCGIRLKDSKNRPEVSHQHYNTDSDYIISSAEKSIQNLHSDYIDVLLIHRPDVLMNADEVAHAFDQLRKQGKVKYFGTSNFTPSQFSLLQSRLPFPLVTNQIECSVQHFEPMHDGTLDQAQQYRVPPMAWSPLGGGSLFTDNSEQAKRLRETLEVIGRETGNHGIDEIALAWLLRHPSEMLPVLGTGKLHRVKAALKAMEVSLSREQWYRIWSASTGTNVP